MATYTALGNPSVEDGALREIAEDGGFTRWTINRHAEIGDEILIYLTAPVSAFVARGTVASLPSMGDEENGDWTDHFMSDIEDLSLIRQRIHIKSLRARFPEWGWLASPIQSSRVPEEVLQSLMELFGEADREVYNDVFQDIDEEAISAAEGDPRLVLHLRRERSPKLVKAKRAAVLDEKGCLACEVCGFDFAITYGLLAPDYCEIHHLTPLSEMEAGAKTTLSDLAVLCSNCHRVIHKREPMLNPKQMRTQLRGRSTRKATRVKVSTKRQRVR